MPASSTVIPTVTERWPAVRRRNGRDRQLVGPQEPAPAKAGVKGIRKLIEARGAKLIYLPPYSPDLNPIEMVFAKLKALLRKAAERTRDALWHRIGLLLDAFTPTECANYLAHAGYAPS